MQQQAIESILAQQGLLKNLTPKQIEQVAGCASNASWEPGEFIFREGEAANHFYIITRGMVVLEMFVPGRGSISIETINEGDVLGWSWLFPPYRWHFDGRALEMTRAISFDA